MSAFHEKALLRVIPVAKAVAESFGLSSLFGLITDPVEQQLKLDELTREKLLPDPRKAPPSDLSPVGQLNPAYCAIPFSGREAELENYVNWCGANDRLSVRLVTGGSGRGKTRLMVELAARLRDESPVSTGHTDSTWIAGFLDIETLKTAQATGNPFDIPFAAQGDLCLLVDYAETRKEDVQNLLRSALSAAGEDRPDKIRVLLAARSKSEVFDEILGHSDLRNRRLVEIRDLPLPELESRQSFFNEACKALGRDEEAPKLPKKLEGADPGILALAALIVAKGGNIQKPQRDILKDVLRHEKRYWEMELEKRGIKSAVDGKEAMEVQAVACLTLLGLQGAVPDLDTGSKLLKFLPALEDQNTDTRQALAQMVRDLYPAAEDAQRIEGITLDLLGDHLIETTPNIVRHVFAAHRADGGLALSKQQMESAFTRIAWITQRDRDVGEKLFFEALGGKV